MRRMILIKYDEHGGAAMNKERRRKIDKAVENVNSLQNVLEELQQQIEEIRDEEQDYLDNIPENLQNSERYETAENDLDNLEEAVNWFDNIDIDELLSLLEEAKG